MRTVDRPVYKAWLEKGPLRAEDATGEQLLMWCEPRTKRVFLEMLQDKTKGRQPKTGCCGVSLTKNSRSAELCFFSTGELEPLSLRKQKKKKKKLEQIEYY